MKIHLHLGAHKTATTYIQSQLFDNRADLATTGAGFVGLWVMRKQFTRLFETLGWFDPVWAPVTRWILRRRLRVILKPHGGKKLVILSDENLAGLIRTNYWRGGLYRGLKARMKMLRSVFSGHDVHYFFCIRPYADHLTSSYLQWAATGKPPSFDTFLARFGPDMPGWAEAVAAIAGAAGKDRVTVWTYDWFKQDPSRLLLLLAPGSQLKVTEEELKRDILPSLTLRGLDVMQKLEKSLSKAERVKMGKLLRNFPFDGPNPRLEITDPALLAGFEAKYADDLAAIRGLGISFFETASEAGLPPDLQ